VDQLEHIIKGCRDEDPKAQKELYQMFAGRMFSLCLRYADNEDEAKDNLQEGFIRVFRKIKQYRFEGSFEGWMRKIMVNISLQKYRDRLKMNPVYELEGVREQASETASDLVTEKDLLQMISELPPRYRLVFNMYAIEGYSHKEISEMLGITEGTSKSNLSRARDILQNKLKKYSEINYRAG